MDVNEKKGLKGVCLLIAIAFLGFLQSFSTEVGADALVNLIPGSVGNVWSILIRVVILLVISLGFCFFLETYTKGTATINYVPYSIGGTLALLIFEIATELMDNISNQSLWSLFGQMNNATYGIGLGVSVAVFLVTAFLIGVATKKKEAMVGTGTDNANAKERYYYYIIWGVIDIFITLVLLGLFILINTGFPKWFNYVYWG